MKNNLFLEITKRLIKKTKIRTLLLLIVLLSLNATAWFIYATKVDTGIGAKIVAWNVSFVTGEDELIEYINFKIDNIYPGMETYKQRIDVTNQGESEANLTYELQKVRILESEYSIDNRTITSDSLLYSLENDYPFKIKVGVSNYDLKPGEQAYFYVEVFWDFESGDDEQDSYWGEQAYEFYENNPNKESIELDLVVSAIQKKQG